jgi:hypothetical protein
VYRRDVDWRAAVDGNHRRDRRKHSRVGAGWVARGLRNDARVADADARGEPVVDNHDAVSQRRVARRRGGPGSGNGRASGPRGRDAIVVHADDADLVVDQRANRDLAGVQLHDVVIVRSANLEPPLEQGNRRAVRLHGDVELRAFDDRNEQRRLDAQLAEIARCDVVEDVAAVLNHSGYEVAVDRFGGNLDVRVARDAHVGARLREAYGAVMTGDDARG